MAQLLTYRDKAFYLSSQADQGEHKQRCSHVAHGDWIDYIDLQVGNLTREQLLDVRRSNVVFIKKYLEESHCQMKL